MVSTTFFSTTSSELTVSPVRINEAPTSIKIEILKYLPPHEIAIHVERINKDWNILTKQVWNLLAKRFHLEVTSENVKLIVIEDGKYRPIIQVFEAYLKSETTLPNLPKRLSSLKTQKEKFEASKKIISEYPFLVPLFCTYICQNNPKEKEIRALKAFIKNNRSMALFEPYQFVKASPYHAIFQALLEELKNTEGDHTSRLGQVGKEIVRKTASVPILKALCDAGFRPDHMDLFQAAMNCKFEVKRKDGHLKVLLDYSNKNERETAIRELQKQWHENMEANKRDYSELDKDFEEILEKSTNLAFAEKIHMIEMAPPPTFGGTTEVNGPEMIDIVEKTLPPSFGKMSEIHKEPVKPKITLKNKLSLL